MPTKLTDDIRILLALKHGYHVIDFYKSGYGWSNPPVSWCAIQNEPDPDAPSIRCVSGAAVWRSKRAGMTELSERSIETGLGHTYYFQLTAAGLAAADAITDVSIEKAIAQPKRPPTPEGMDWRDEWDWKRARKALKAIVEREQVLTEVRRENEAQAHYYTYPIQTHTRYPKTRSVDLREFKYLAAFVERAPDGIDFYGQSTICWRPTDEAVEIITKRRPLPVRKAA